jgi:hypothetical protein
MAEEKVTKNKDIELLETRVEELEAELKKVMEIANGYIKAYRNLLGQLNITVQTQADIEAALNEKLK